MCVCVSMCVHGCVYVCVCVYSCVCTMLVSSAGWGMCGSGHTCTQSYCAHGRTVERKYIGAPCKKKTTKKASPPKQDSVVQAQPGPDKYPKSDKANAPNSNTEREEKQPEGCEKDPKSMEESEEKSPEGYNKDPTGAAQLWLAGLKTKEEGEKKKNKSNKIKWAMALLRAFAV